MDNYGKLALGLSTAEAIWLTYLTYEKVMKDRKDEKFDLAVTENLQRHEKLLETMLAQLNQLNTKLAAFEHFRQVMGKMQDQLADLQDEVDEYKDFDPGYVIAQLNNILRDADKAQMPIERAPATKKKKSKHSKNRRPRRKTTPPPSSSESSSAASSSSSSSEDERRHFKSKSGKSSRHSKSRHFKSRKDSSDSETEGYDTSADVARVRAANAATSSSNRTSSRRH